MSDVRVPLSVALDAFGVDVTVTRPGQPSITTRGIWDASPPEEERPFGTDFQRRVARQVMALPREGLTELERGTVIAAPEYEGGPTKTWKIDGFSQRVEYDCWRVIVALATS